MVLIQIKQVGFARTAIYNVLHVLEKLQMNALAVLQVISYKKLPRLALQVVIQEHTLIFHQNNANIVKEDALHAKIQL